MENLVFSLNATVPIFMMMVLGMFFRKVKLIDARFTASLNQFVFKAALPAVLFEDMSTSDFFQVWNTKFVLYCFFATLAEILIAALISMLLKDKSLRGEFIQGAYRSSAAILGIAFIKNIYGNAGLGPLMILASVPLYNVIAVTVLSLTRPGSGGLDGNVLKKTLKGIVTNPIILGIAIGALWSVLRIPQPRIMQKTVSNLAQVATPLGLSAMGADFDFEKIKGSVLPSAAASALKLVGFCAVFLPIAVALGFREEQLVAILVMLGSATTVSCYVMARNMGHEGVLTSSVVALTTCASAFSLTFWLYVVKTAGWI